MLATFLKIATVTVLGYGALHAAQGVGEFIDKKFRGGMEQVGQQLTTYNLPTFGALPVAVAKAALLPTPTPPARQVETIVTQIEARGAAYTAPLMEQATSLEIVRDFYTDIKK